MTDVDERDAAKRIAVEALRIMTSDQMLELRRVLDELEEGEDVRSG